MQWLLERFASADPQRAAFVHKGQVCTYGQVSADIRRFTETLSRQGVSAGQTVVVLADYAPEVFSIILALASLKTMVVPMTRGSVIEESEALAISGCDHLIEFSPDGLSWALRPRSVPVSNALLDELRASVRAGLVLFSSGSTGKPKGMLHDFERVMDKFRVARTPVVAIPFLMLDHFGGINTILAITASLGTVVTAENRSIPTICEAIQNHRVELLPTTPSFLTLLAATDLAQRYDLSSLKRITYGTETMPQATLDRIRAKFPAVELQQTYGLSEVGVLRSQSRPDGSLWVRIGGSGFETEVRDGILWIRSDYRMLGYLNAASGFDAEGWFNTQDRVEVDGDYFRILGRVTDLINVGGQKVYPAEVEDVILALPNVADVVVVGEKHALLGQIVVAKIALHDAEPLSELRLRVRKACLAKLAAFKVPAKVELLDQEIYSARFKKMRR
ncbi:long-chain fatty acid--CoA ligase [Paucibacter sp. TC2R-5]|uniref:class I adenylate-forming enzyme family protein n=1 Tax=Paucibacter sp. TC2R-5 TaxID=2893555 RepID=UPI0021E389F7|nr:long-chain fatty acid--CoA ligase [Paucibacter sp. TC2R-5]MCV2360815.1 long-chain fatty acid--CoA ligase [Paucibacter sp. TC2R-5]